MFDKKEVDSDVKSRENCSSEFKEVRCLQDGMSIAKQEEVREIVGKYNFAADLATSVTANQQSCVNLSAKYSGETPQQVRGDVNDIHPSGSELCKIVDAEVVVALTSAEATHSATTSKEIETLWQTKSIVPFDSAEVTHA